MLFLFATNRKLHEAFVSGTQILFFFSPKSQCERKAAVAVVKKPVKLKVARLIDIVTTRWCCVNKAQAVNCKHGEAVLQV